MANTHSASLLGLMVQNFRSTGTFNAASAHEVVKALAETSLSPQEIASSFRDNVLEAIPFAEVGAEDAGTVV